MKLKESVLQTENAKKIMVCMLVFFVFFILLISLLWNTNRQAEIFVQEDLELKGDISITYSYEGDQPEKIVLCTNEGTLPTDWYENHMICGKNKRFTITLKDIVSLKGLLLEMRSKAAAVNFHGKMRISEIVFI